MAQRYGQVAAMAITATILFSNIAWVGAMLVAFGLIFETLTGTPLIVGIVGGALVIFVYTAVGGLWAVALTDFLQMVILVVGLIMLLIVVLTDVGGWSAIGPRLPADTFRLLPGENTGEQWLNYLRAWTIVGLVDLSAQTLVQRALAAKSERAAQNAFYLGGLGYFVFGMIPVTLGIIASVSMPELADPESVIPSLAIEHLHPVAVAIFVGALLAAIMSSADSALLGCASMIANNVLPLVRHNPSDRLGLIVARTSIPVCGVVAIIVALKIQVVFDLMLDANILGLAAIIVPFILGVWWKKANRTGALSAMAIGNGRRPVGLAADAVLRSAPACRLCRTRRLVIDDARRNATDTEDRSAPGTGRQRRQAGRDDRPAWHAASLEANRQLTIHCPRTEAQKRTTMPADSSVTSSTSEISNISYSPRISTDPRVNRTPTP
jgi:Na+/proline symporter